MRADTFSTRLTVRENLAYAAALRLGTQLSSEALLDRIEQLHTLGGEAVVEDDTRVSDARRGGVLDLQCVKGEHERT